MARLCRNGYDGSTSRTRKRDLEDSFTNKTDEANTAKTDDAETSKVDEEATSKVENQQAEAPKKEGDGEAYEQGVSTKAK
ncbi:MAG: hypothetical protein HC854_09185 [Flavobacterium sp.]|nr:hypothetical protein [Flavobacterium sp.]